MTPDDFDFWVDETGLDDPRDEGEDEDGYCESEEWNPMWAPMPPPAPPGDDDLPF